MIEKFTATLVCLCFLALLQACGNSKNQAAQQSTQQARIFDIDITSSRLNGAFTIDGQPYDAAQASGGFYQLVPSSSAQDSVNLGYFFDQTYDLNVINGQYSLSYYHQFGQQTPLNYQETITDIDVQADSVFNIDLARVEVTPAFTLNGNPFPQSALERAAFYLQSVNSDELIFLGYSNTANAPVGVIPGTYAVIYQYQSGSQLPANTHAVIIDKLLLDKQQSLDIDIASVTLTAIFRLNGQSFPASAYEYANIGLTDPQHLDHVDLGPTYFSTATVSNIIPGNYQATYHHQQGTQLPQNPDFVLDKVYDLSNTNSRLEVDVPAIVLQGNFNVNGQTAPLSAYRFAQISLKERNSGSELEIGNTYEQSYSGLSIIPGQYDVIYLRQEQIDTLPENSKGTIEANLQLTNSRQLDIDIRAVNVSASFTLDGAPFPLNAYNYAEIYIREISEQDPVLLTDTLQASGTVILLPGTYQVFYRVRERSGQPPLPANSHFVFLNDLVITSDMSIEHNLESAEIRLNLTLNGQAFPNSAYDYARIYLASNDNEQIFAMNTFGGMLPLRLLRGTYQVYYEFREGLDSMPANSYALIGEISNSNNERD